MMWPSLILAAATLCLFYVCFWIKIDILCIAQFVGFFFLNATLIRTTGKTLH